MVSIVLILLQQSVWAQSRLSEFDLDIDPPVIDHEALEAGIAGESQTFIALVFDDRGIDYVDFYYRSDRRNDYNKVNMMPDGRSRYIATVATGFGQTSIEYYIEAADMGGNRVLKGFPFYPLVRNLEVPSLPLLASTSDTSTSNGGTPQLLYMLLGALAVGLLASAVSSSDGDNNGANTDSAGVESGPSGMVPLTINITSPD